MAILPFGAHHEDASENLELLVPPRLRRNQALGRSLQQGARRRYTASNSGVLLPSLTIPIDSIKLTDLFNYIARALVHYHFSIRLSEMDFVESSIRFRDIDSFIDGKSRSKVQVSLGNGTVNYCGVQALDNRKVTAWDFEMYGGLSFREGTKTNIVSFTGTDEMRQRIDAAKT